MPSKSTSASKKTQSAPVEETFDMSSMFKTVQDMSTKLSHHCTKNVPIDLPEDRDKVNKMYETVRDGYIELSRVRELVGTTLREFGEVMRRLAESRAKANACAEVEPEPPAHENVLNEESHDEAESDVEANEKKAEPEDEKPKKKDKKDKSDKKEKKLDKKKVDSDVEEEAEPEPEPAPKSKSKKEKKKVDSDVEEEAEAEPEPAPKSKKDKKDKKH